MKIKQRTNENNEKDARKLEGKIALITGGNSGIGLATAKQFVSEGAYIFITGRRESELAPAVKEIGRNVTGVQGDVSNLGDLDRLFVIINREKSKLDVVFANAGVAKYAPFGKVTEELYDSIFNINVKGLFFTVQKALPLLPDGASIILNASVVGSKGLAANSVYSATKAAVRSFARTWTTDLKDRRIRVNAVSPGPIETPGLSNLVASSEMGRQRMAAISTTVPLGRLGTPDEIARAVVFLASDDSSYITGTELFVDGGFAGLSAAMYLDKTVARCADVEVTLINRENFILFTPMLHEVASGDLYPGDIVNPIRRILRHVKFVEAEVQAIDLSARRVRCVGGVARLVLEFEFDHLLLTLGSETNFFGLPGVSDWAVTMKSIFDAAMLRNRVLALLEEATLQSDSAARRRLLTFVTAGGGVAGAETTG